MALEQITRQVLSYCEIPEEIDKGWIEENSSDCYINYTISSDPKYSRTELDDWIAETYPELIDTEFFIHLDY